MNLKDLPKEIEEIIQDYKSQLEYSERYDKIVKDINGNLKVEYVVPLWDSDTGYIGKLVKYKEEYYKRFTTIICFCCGRDISLTYDEYTEDEMETEDIDHQLHFLYKSILRDIQKKRYEVLEDLNENGYIKIKEIIEERMESFIIGTTELDDNEYRVLIDLEDDGEIEDIIDSDEEVIDYTPEELLEIIEEIGFRDLDDIQDSSDDMEIVD